MYRFGGIVAVLEQPPSTGVEVCVVSGAIVCTLVENYWWTIFRCRTIAQFVDAFLVSRECTSCPIRAIFGHSGAVLSSLVREENVRRSYCML